MTRDYRKEYDTFHGTDREKKRRAGRNAALALIKKVNGGKKPNGDVHHKDHNPTNNNKSNLSIKSVASNRSDNKRRRG
tara:strand:+ start:512 stop:745 length:234 start_codon:yes stop_codon:yes gene_type:complete